jgi:hypothetical protein
MLNNNIHLPREDDGGSGEITATSRDIKYNVASASRRERVSQCNEGRKAREESEEIERKTAFIDDRRMKCVRTKCRSLSLYYFMGQCWASDIFMDFI